jgi:hypothetical protein
MYDSIFDCGRDGPTAPQVAGNMDEAAPSVLDKLGADRRAAFDNNLARVIADALQKRVELRYQSADEMHEAVYCCLIDRGEAFYRCRPRGSRPA